MNRAVASVVLALAAAGCGRQSTVPALEHGRSLFSSPAFSPAESNVFACSTCHSVLAAGDPVLKLPGYTLFDAVARPSWWGKSYAYLLDAVNECYVEFMRGPRLGPGDTDGRSLLLYLQSLAPDASAPALPLTTVETLDKTYYDQLKGGDPVKGKATYTAACANCHGDLHSGAGRLGPKVSIIPEESIQQHGPGDGLHLDGARPITIEKVRHGKFFSVGGNMAQYSLETLADADLADILAYMGF